MYMNRKGKAMAFITSIAAQTRFRVAGGAFLRVSGGALLGTLLGLSASGQAMAAASDWYIGAGAGMTELSPDTSAAGLSVDDDQSTLVSVYAGRRIGRFALELGYSDLGEATLSDGNTVSYQAVSFGGLYRQPLGRDRRGNERAALFARLGVNGMQNDSALPLDKADNAGLWAGAGAEWMFGPQLALRGEVASYDGDALGGLVSLRWHPVRDSRPQRARRGEPPADPNAPDAMPGAPGTLPGADMSATESTLADGGATENDAAAGAVTAGSAAAGSAAANAAAEGAVAEGTVAERAEGALAEGQGQVGDDGSDLIEPLITSGNCESPASTAEPTDASGCAMLSGPVSGIYFQDGSRDLAPDSTQALDMLAERLKRYPNLLVELQTYTAPSADSADPLALSRERVMVLARDLVRRGVDLQSLRARAFGATTDGGDGVRLKVLGSR